MNVGTTRIENYARALAARAELVHSIDDVLSGVFTCLNPEGGETTPSAFIGYYKVERTKIVVAFQVTNSGAMSVKLLAKHPRHSHYIDVSEVVNFEEVHGTNLISPTERKLAKAGVDKWSYQHLYFPDSFDAGLQSLYDYVAFLVQALG